MKAEEHELILLQRSFTGELTGAERRMLDAWLAADPGHAELARQYTLIWEQAGTFQPAVALDLEADFQSVLERIRNEERRLTPSLPLHGWRRRWLSVAAIAVLLLAATLFYRQYTLPSVQWQSAVADSEVRQVELADGSRIWLRSGGQIEYPAAFSASERRVRLTGEAYFEVARREDQPFIVETGDGGSVEVLGTAFGVLSGHVVLVKSGKVRYRPEADGEGVVLNAGQRAEYLPASHTIKVGAALTFNELAWQAGGLEFVQTPLRQVIADLQRFYQVRISLENASLQDCLYTAPLTRQPVEQVLKGLALTFRLELAQPESGHFVLRGGDCR